MGAQEIQEKGSGLQVPPNSTPNKRGESHQCQSGHTIPSLPTWHTRKLIGKIGGVLWGISGEGGGPAEREREGYRQIACVCAVQQESQTHGSSLAASPRSIQPSSGRSGTALAMFRARSLCSLARSLGSSDPPVFHYAPPDAVSHVSLFK